MTRVLSSACVVLLVLMLGGTARAGSKPAIAILGLEVYDNGGGIDPETTRAAKELTTALRDRAKAGTGPYIPVQGGEKELIDEKLLNNCDTEANTCMATIGTELGAEVLMYGRIWVERTPQTNQTTYKISLKLLNVKGKQLASSTVEALPVAESTGVRASAHAKAWYAKLVGAVSGGTLVVRGNADRATVLVDDEAKGSLTSGSLTLAGIPEGRHTLVIEAKDYQRYETQITVRTGETTTQNVTLVELPHKTVQAPEPGDPITREGTISARRSNLWKPVFYGTTVLTAAAAGFSVFAIVKSKSAADDIKLPNMQTVSQSDCGKADLRTADQKFDSACNWHKAQIVGWVVTGVMGAAAIGSFVMAYMRDSGSERETKGAARGHRKRRELAVTPIATPDGGGATLRFDW